MGMVHAEITLANAYDVAQARRGEIAETDVRKVTVDSLVDSGCYVLAINQTIQMQLGLQTVKTKNATLADGSIITHDVTEPVSVYFQNRSTTCDALVLPNAKKVLLGAIPLEDLDVIIDPKTQSLAVHPDRPYIAGTLVM